MERVKTPTLPISSVIAHIASRENSAILRLLDDLSGHIALDRQCAVHFPVGVQAEFDSTSKYSICAPIFAATETVASRSLSRLWGGPTPASENVVMFTVTNPGLIDSVVLMLQWPFSYALNQGNVDKFLVPHYVAHSGLEQAVEVLIELQKGLSDLPSNEVAWRKAMELRENSSHRPAVHTDWLVAEDPSIKKVAPMLDTTLHESVCVALHRKKSLAGRSCSVDTLNLLTQCVWLSEHIALCVLGIAHAALDGEIRPRVENKRTGSR